MKKLIKVIIIFFSLIGVVGTILMILSIITSQNKDERTVLNSDNVWAYIRNANPDRQMNKDWYLCEIAQEKVDSLYSDFEHFSHDGFVQKSQDWLETSDYSTLVEITARSDYENKENKNLNQEVVYNWLTSDTGHADAILDDTLIAGCVICKFNYCVGIFAK